MRRKKKKKNMRTQQQNPSPRNQASPIPRSNMDTHGSCWVSPGGVANETKRGGKKGKKKKKKRKKKELFGIYN